VAAPPPGQGPLVPPRGTAATPGDQPVITSRATAKPPPRVL
jgi:hypothetical protein